MFVGQAEDGRRGRSPSRGRGDGYKRKNQSLGLIDGWLREIRDVYRLHAAELDAIENEGARYNRLIELNVLEQCNNILKTEYFQKSHAAGGAPSVHGWIFDISKGALLDLDYDYKAQIENMKAIYDING